MSNDSAQAVQDINGVPHITLGANVKYLSQVRFGTIVGTRLSGDGSIDVLVKHSNGNKEFVPLRNVERAGDGNVQCQSPDAMSPASQEPEPKPYYHARHGEARDNAREAVQLFAAFLTTRPLMIVGEHATACGVIDALGEWMRRVGLDEVGEDA